jgi:hypothetical protein
VNFGLVRQTVETAKKSFDRLASHLNAALAAADLRVEKTAQMVQVPLRR